MEQVEILVEQGVQPFDYGQIAEVSGYVSSRKRNCAGICAKAGGKAVFAHPYLVSHDMERLTWYVRDFSEAGLFGVEVEHRDNPNDVRPALREIAQDAGVEIFGASDSHGAGKPNRLGENVTAPEVIARLEDGAALPILRPSA